MINFVKLAERFAWDGLHWHVEGSEADHSSRGHVPHANFATKQRLCD